MVPRSSFMRLNGTVQFSEDHSLKSLLFPPCLFWLLCHKLTEHTRVVSLLGSRLWSAGPRAQHRAVLDPTASPHSGMLFSRALWHSLWFHEPKDGLSRFCEKQL